MKKYIYAFIAICAISISTVHAADDITILINETEAVFGQEPFIDDGTTLVPMRAIFEELGASVEWDGDSRTITSQKDDTVIVLGIDDPQMTVNGASYTLEKAPIIVDDFTYVPLRAVSEAFGCGVDWDGDSRTVTITYTDDIYADSDYVAEFMKNMPDNENYIISPLSLKLAMMMLANGAEGKTQAEILSAFGVDDIEAYNAYAKEMSKDICGSDDGVISIANSIWFNKDYYKLDDADFSDAYKEVITDSYSGNAETVTDNDSVERVNDWVTEKTNGKISELLSDGDRNYLLALVNAIYMKSEWENKFDPRDTYEGTFIDINGNEKKIDFMHGKDYYGYFRDEDTEILRMPYKNGVSMYVVLGDTSTFSRDILEMYAREVKVTFPKFSSDYTVKLEEILQNMGVRSIFADFNTELDPMVQNVPEPIKVAKAIQKAVIDVDEEGTEAAAATAIIAVGATAVADDSVYFIADRPFTYYIIDDNYGEVLFAGRYVK